MRSPATRRPPPDPTIYPEEEREGECGVDRGQGILQTWIMELLRPLLERWLNSRRSQAFVGAEQFIYWRQYDSHARVAPDIYVIPGLDPHTRVRTWKLWVDQIVPSFALEIVSQDWEKDYCEAPKRYDELGVPELMIFDPSYKEHDHGARWQVFRRIGRRGLVRVEATQGDRVRSKALGCWLRSIGDGRDTRLRIGIGSGGEDLVPTAEEEERAAKEAERGAKEQERAAKEAALERVSSLETELKALRRPAGKRRPR